MKLKQAQNLKAKLSPTLKSWFPILQSSTMDLEEVLGEFVLENPFVDIQSNIRQILPPLKNPRFNTADSRFYMSDKIEALSVYEKSLYEILESQILPPLFPTPISQKIAFEIIDYIANDGYFEGNIEEIAKRCGIECSVVENIRMRFSKLDPPGVGAINDIESMIFQLENFDLDAELYDLSFKIISDLKNHKKYMNNKSYNQAMNLISKLKNPPALDYLPIESSIIPDILIHSSTDGFEVNLNDDYYPEIVVTNNIKDSKENAIKAKLKEARDLVDALNMRKSTIKKIGLMLLEYQYDFFIGGDIKPLKLKDIALELGHNPSTISRAIANKYLECNRGIYPLKSFFTAAIADDTSNTSIKDFILECIRGENKKSPLSDIKILKLIEDKYQIKMVRRTITKYRKQLNIASSGERRRLYEMKL